MANKKPVEVKPNTLLDVPKGAKVLFTTRKVNIDVPAGRMLVSVDLNKVVGKSKNEEDYNVKVDHLKLLYEAEIIGFNMYVLRKGKVDEAVAPATTTKTFTM